MRTAIHCGIEGVLQPGGDSPVSGAVPEGVSFRSDTYFAMITELSHGLR